MSIVEEHFATMAAILTDVELVWRLSRLPAQEDWTKLDRALVSEADKRGLITAHEPNSQN